VAVQEPFQVQEESPGHLIADESIQDEEDGDILDLQMQTTKGVHLQSELDGQLKSMTGTMNNQ
jgi:hypothetical protein